MTENPIPEPAWKAKLSPLVRKLAHVRKYISLRTGAVRDLETQLAQTPTGQALAYERRKIRDLIIETDRAEKEIRSIAADVYSELRSQGVAAKDIELLPPAVKARKKVVVSYETDRALAWALERRMVEVLKVDYQAFEKVVRALPPERLPPFVVVAEEVEPTIAGDLTDFLPDNWRDIEPELSEETADGS